MKKYQLSFLILFLLVAIIPCLVWAESPGDVGTPTGSSIFDNPLTGVSSITALLSKVLDIVVQVGLVFIVFFIIFAGFNFVTARGDTAKLTKARDALVNVLIGSAIVLGSYAIAKALDSTVKQLQTGIPTSQLEENLKFKV